MKKILLFLVLIASVGQLVTAQYAPQAGLSGSTAIAASSGLFVSWAQHCAIQRGYMNIANPSLGYASAGDSIAATGVPDNGIVSLGDSGMAILTFAHPIMNGAGADFAVFENGFINTANDSEAFLELAFVEVSSDGVNYTRFPAASLTQINVQLGNGNYINAGNLNNLAGKYIGMFGTPFDLNELAGTPGLDINNITHIRLVDVVGAISTHSSFDHSGRAINDPYPTPFPSCGFDLDAVGVIHQVESRVHDFGGGATLNIYPNPATDRLNIKMQGTDASGLEVTFTDLAGRQLAHVIAGTGGAEIRLSQFPAGLYLLVLRDANGNQWVEKITKQ